MYYETPELLQAAIDNDFEALKRAHAKGADVNESTKSGTSPLIYASQNNNLEMVRFLVEFGADVIKKTKLVDQL